MSPPGGAEPSHGVDRSAALAAGAPGVPVRFVWWLVAGALVLTVAGLLGEHLFTSAGLNPTAATTPTAVTAHGPTPVPVSTPPAADRSLTASLASFMGLSTPVPLPHPPSP